MKIRPSRVGALVTALLLFGIGASVAPMQYSRTTVSAHAGLPAPLDDPDTDSSEDDSALLQQEQDDDWRRQQEYDDAQAQRALDQTAQDSYEAQQQTEQQNDAAQQQALVDQQLASQ